VLSGLSIERLSGKILAATKSNIITLIDEYKLVGWSSFG